MANNPEVDGVGLPARGPLRYLDMRDQGTTFALPVPLVAWDAAARTADTGFATAPRSPGPC